MKLLENEDFQDAACIQGFVEQCNRMLSAKAGAVPQFDLWLCEILVTESHIEQTDSAFFLRGYVKGQNGQTVQITLKGDRV